MVPRRRPTDTLIMLSSILKPREEMGRAFNHAPDSLVEAAMRRARDCASGALILQHRIGHRRYFGGIPDLLAMGSRSHRWRIVLRDHDARAKSTWSKSCGPKRGGRMCRTRSVEAAAEERKAEGASCTALRIPSPPAFTGRDAWFHALSSRCVFAIVPTIDFRTSS